MRGGCGAAWGRGPGRALTACSRRSEYNAFWKCVQAGVTYLFVQLCKMLFLATFFPTWEGGIYDFIGEFMKASVDVADLIGLNLVMSRNAGKGEYKIMVAALGWATAELIMSRCVQQPGAQIPKKGHLGFREVLEGGGSDSGC